MSSIIVEGTAVMAIETLTANQVTEAIAGFDADAVVGGAKQDHDQ